MTVLTAEGVTVARGDRTVVEGVDLELHRDEVTAVIGPNGAGKSTLLLALAGLLKLESGTVERHGRVAAALQAPALAHRTVLANVELALSWWGAPRRSRRPRAQAALESLRAAHLSDRSARSLSGGEARRVHLARAVSLDPDLLLLDEPFSGLDPQTRAELLLDVETPLRAEGRSTLIIVHDRAEAWALADRVAVMLNGRLAAIGPPGEVFERPPSPDVARFVGFAGTLADGDRQRLFRPSDVRIDPEGPIAGAVRRRVPTDDGVRVHLEVPGGDLVAVAPLPGPAEGELVRVRVSGSVSFPAG